MAKEKNKKGKCQKKQVADCMENGWKRSLIEICSDETLEESTKVELLIALYLRQRNHIAIVHQQIGSLKDLQSGISSDESRLNSPLIALKKELDGLNEAIKRLEALRSALGIRHEELLKKRQKELEMVEDKKRAHTEDLKRRLDLIQRRQDGQTKEYDILQEESSELKRLLKAELGKLSDESKEYDGVISAVAENIARLQERSNGLEETSQMITEDLSQYEVLAEQSKEKELVLKNDLYDYNKKMDEYKGHLEQNNVAFLKGREDIHKSLQQIKVKIVQAQDAEREKCALNNQYKKIRKEVSNMHEKNSLVAGELDRTMAKIDLLKKLKDKLVDENSINHINN